jgi:DNA primase small subunit
MGPVTPQQKSLAFLQDSFRSYYTSHQPILPDRFSRREFAFVFFEGKGMLRHLAFTRKNEIKSFLMKRAPSHAYYSTAFYQQPDAPTMNEKNWMGAELIFDLDADHLPNAEEIPYEQQLALVKKEFIKLVDDFLLNDFGFDEKNLDLYFSGGRGYHCHVNDPRIYQLNSGERREIVDYIIGRNLNEHLVFHQQSTGRMQIKGKTVSTGTSLKMPSPQEPGWRGRISRGLIDIIEEIMHSDAPIEQLKTYGVSEQTAEKLLEDLSQERLERIKQGQLDQSTAIRKFFLNRALRKTAVSFAAGETDEPVTCDVKRLIRLPSSLHGKTGLRVTPVTLDGLKIFDPLQDTIVFSDDPVTITLSSPFQIRMKKEVFHLEKGTQEVPRYLAVFLIGRRLAILD